MKGGKDLDKGIQIGGHLLGRPVWAKACAYDVREFR